MPPQTEFQRKSSCLFWIIVAVFIAAAIVSLLNTGCTPSVGTAENTAEETAANLTGLKAKTRSSFWRPSIDDQVFLVRSDGLFLSEDENLNPSPGFSQASSCIPSWKVGYLDHGVVKLTLVTIGSFSGDAVQVKFSDDCSAWVGSGFLYPLADS